MLHIRTLFFNLSLLLLVMSLASVSLAAPLTDTENKHNLSSSATHGGPKAADPTAGGTTVPGSQKFPIVQGRHCGRDPATLA